MINILEKQKAIYNKLNDLFALEQEDAEIKLKFTEWFGEQEDSNWEDEYKKR